MSSSPTSRGAEDPELAALLDCMDFEDDERGAVAEAPLVIRGGESFLDAALATKSCCSAGFGPEEARRKVVEFDEQLREVFRRIEDHNRRELPNITGSMRMLQIATITIMCSLTAPNVDFQNTVLGFYNHKKQRAIADLMEENRLGEYVLVPPRSIDTSLADRQLAEYLRECRRRKKQARSGGTGGGVPSRDPGPAAEGERDKKRKNKKRKDDGDEEEDEDDETLLAEITRGRRGRVVPPSNASFQNAVIFKYKEDKERTGMNSKAIKIFCNGTLHVTGCKTAGECADVTRIVCRILEIVHDVPEPGTYALSGFNVQLINTSFCVGVRLNICALRSIFIHEYGIDNVSYDPGMHAGLNVKHRVMGKDDFARDVTVLIFESGEVIITGCVNAEELWATYENYSTLLNQNVGRVRLSEVTEADIKEQRRLKRASAAAAKQLVLRDDDDDDVETEGESPKKKKRNKKHTAQGVRVVLGNGFKVFR